MQAKKRIPGRKFGDSVPGALMCSCELKGKLRRLSDNPGACRFSCVDFLPGYKAPSIAPIVVSATVA